MRKMLLLAAAFAGIAAAANATVLTAGGTTVGLTDSARLGSEGFGISFNGSDAILPGCLCEGWGVSGGVDSRSTYGNGFTNFASSGVSDVTGSSATFTTDAGNGLSVVHSWSAAPGTDFFRINITITNTTADTISDVRYARTLDWDVTPGFFTNNFSSIYGGPGGAPSGKILHTSLDPFAQPNPLVTRASFANQNRSNEPGDLGGYFIFSFGDLEAGESTAFETVIGAASSPRALLAALGDLDVEAYSYTTGSGFGDTFGYGFVGIGLPPIDTPAPAALALFGLGLAGLAAARRRRA